MKKYSYKEVERGITKIDSLPFYLKGKVIPGFQRGSKELGFPTANIPIEPYQELLQVIPTGIYSGWISLEENVYKMAMSIGWNPFYKNEKKTIEIHIIHTFENDFYGKEIFAIALEYIRPELDFLSLEDLKSAIKDDIDYASVKLNETNNLFYKTDKFFINKL